MAQVESLMVRLSVDISNFERNMERAKNGVQNLQKQLKDMSGVLNTVSDGLKTVGKNLTKYVTTPIVAGIGAGVKFNSTMEDALTNFTTMLGSAEKAQGMVSNLQSMASKTPFGMDDLQKGATTLLSFGQSAESILPTLKMLGDVSLGNKQKMESLTLAFAQVQSAGKLSGQDLLQMINAGFNPLQIISEKTGKSMAELKDIMAEGGITADMVTAAFQAATSEGGRFYQGMDNASKTLAGSFSTLKDSVMELFGELAKPVFDWLKEKIQEVTQVIENIKSKFDALDESTKKQITTILLLIAAIGPLIIAIGGLIGVIGALTAAFAFLAANPVVLTISAIVVAVLALIGILVYLYNTNEKVRTAIQNAWEGLKSFFGALVQIFKQYIQENIDAFRNAWDSIVVILSAIIDIFGEVFGFLGALLTGDWEAMWEHAKNIIKKAVGAIIVVALNLIDNMLLGFQRLSEILLDKVFAGITKGFQSMVNGLLKGWNWLAGKFGWKQVAYLQIDTDKYKVSSAIQKVRNELSKVAEYWRGGEKAQLPGTGKSKLKQPKKPTLPGIPEVSQMDMKQYNDLDNVFADIGETAEKTKNGVDKLADSVKGLVDSLRQQTQSFRDALGMFDTFERKVVSPERLMNRMKAQVKAMSQWTSALATLNNRGVNQSFLNDLRAAGPQNVDYIRALASMTDSQLAQYQNMYGQKYDIAQREAERMVTTQQRIDKYVEQEISINVTGNKISSDDDVDRIAKEIVRKLKLKGV